MARYRNAPTSSDAGGPSQRPFSESVSRHRRREKDYDTVSETETVGPDTPRDLSRQASLSEVEQAAQVNRQRPKAASKATQSSERSIIAPPISDAWARVM